MTPYEKFKSHPFLPLYPKGRVPFDEEESIGDKLFLIPYLAEHPTGGAVVVFPGGGYGFNDNDIDNSGSHAEASDIAEFLYNKEGISVFVVNYRTERFAPHITGRGIMADGLRAVRTIRARAKEFGIDPEKIAVMGFSAGGHLASMMLTNYEFQPWDAGYVKDEIDEVSAKPQAAVLSYAVSTLESAYSHGGTRRRFLQGFDGLTSQDAKAQDAKAQDAKAQDAKAQDAKAQDAKAREAKAREAKAQDSEEKERIAALFSANFLVNDQTSPTFLWHTRHDGAVSAASSIRMARALEAHHVDYELHIYNINIKKHDIGIGQEYLNSALWPIESLRFLKKYGF